jgi:hypothetical protein
MDVKSAFLNGVIQEKVFVRYPLGFENSKYPNRVYKLSKTLYVLKQVLRVWYARLKTFLLEHGYVMGSVNDFLLVQIYVDDIILRRSFHVLVSRFQAMMEKEFQMSMMRELTFFLGIEVKQTTQGTSVYQAKYTKNLKNKFNMVKIKPVSTPMSMATALDSDENGKAADQREYMSMINSLLYLTATRLDIQFDVCLYARFQASLHSSHQTVIQQIFRYLKHTLEFGICYFSSSSLDLVSFSDADFASCGIEQKITSST